MLENWVSSPRYCKSRNITSTATTRTSSPRGGARIFTDTFALVPKLQPTNHTDEDLVRQCLLTLYWDQIRPLHNDIVRRLQEYNASSRLQNTFLSIFELHPEEYVVHREDGTIIVYFSSPPRGFKGWIDPNNPDDPFSADIWKGFLEHISSLMQYHGTQKGTSRQECPNLGLFQFKGGRYGMSVELWKNRLPFLQQLTLGQICHLTQLAISRGVLAYEKSVLQPVAAVRKAACAAVAKVEQNRSGMKDADATRARTLAAIRRQLHEILQERPNGYILSRLNRELWCRYDTKIDPTAHGYTKLSDFLLSEDMRNVCRVSVNRRNHVIVQSTNFRVPESFSPLFQDNKSKAPQTDYWSQHHENISWSHWKFFSATGVHERSRCRSPRSDTSTFTDADATVTLFPPPPLRIAASVGIFPPTPQRLDSSRTISDSWSQYCVSPRSHGPLSDVSTEDASAGDRLSDGSIYRQELTSKLAALKYLESHVPTQAQLEVS